MGNYSPVCYENISDSAFTQKTNLNFSLPFSSFKRIHAEINSLLNWFFFSAFALLKNEVNKALTQFIQRNTERSCYYILEYEISRKKHTCDGSFWIFYCIISICLIALVFHVENMSYSVSYVYIRVRISNFDTPDTHIQRIQGSSVNEGVVIIHQSLRYAQV